MASRYDPAVCSGRRGGEPRWPMTIGRRVCGRCPPRAWATSAPPERPSAAAPATPRFTIDLRVKPGIASPLSPRLIERGPYQRRRAPRVGRARLGPEPVVLLDDLRGR